MKPGEALLVLALVLRGFSGSLAAGVPGAQCTAWKASTDGTLQCTRSTQTSERNTDRVLVTHQLSPVAPVVISAHKVGFLTMDGALLYRAWEQNSWHWVVGPQVHGGNVIKLATRNGVTNYADQTERLLMVVLSNGKLLVQRSRKGRPWQRVDCGRAVLDIGSEAQRQGSVGSGLFLLYRDNIIAIGKFNQETMGWEQWALLNASIPLPALAKDPVSTMSADLIDNTIFLTTRNGMVVSMSKTESSDYTWMNHSFRSFVRCNTALVKISNSFFCISTTGTLIEWLSPGWEQISKFIHNSQDPSFGRWTEVTHNGPVPSGMPNSNPKATPFAPHLPLAVHERSLFMLSTDGQLYERHWDIEKDMWVWFLHPFRETPMHNWSMIGAAVNSRTFFLGSSSHAYEYFYNEAKAKWVFINAKLASL